LLSQDRKPFELQQQTTKNKQTDTFNAFGSNTQQKTNKNNKQQTTNNTNKRILNTYDYLLVNNMAAKVNLEYKK